MKVPPDNLQTRGKPSTWLPRGRLVELCITGNAKFSDNDDTLRRTAVDKGMIEKTTENKIDFFDRHTASFKKFLETGWSDY